MIKTIRFIAAASAVLVYTTAAPAAEISPELIAKAKQEGQVTYYTDLIVDQIVRPLIAAFEAKYGIKVAFTRGDSQVNSIKLLNEYRAGRVMADVFGLTSGMEVLIDAGAVRQFTAANGEELPPQYRDPDRYWVSSHLFVHARRPQHRAWCRRRSGRRPTTTCWRRTGRTRWSGSRTTCRAAPGFIGNVLTQHGRGARHGLSAQARAPEHQDGQRQRPRHPRPGDRRRIPDGAADLQSPRRDQRREGRAGRLGCGSSPATVTPGLVGLPKNAPHPNAGLLFVEFMTSKEGQQIFQKAAYLPARPDVPPTVPGLVPATGGFAATVITPALTAKSMNHWDKVFADLFR